MNYPLLRLNESHIRRFKSESHLKLMSERYFEQGNFRRNAILIDVKGNKCSILDCKRVRRSYNPLYWFRPSPAIIVELSLGPATAILLDKAKTLIRDLVVRNGWYTQGDQTKEEFCSMIDAAWDFPNLISMISFYGKWQG